MTISSGIWGFRRGWAVIGRRGYEARVAAELTAELAAVDATASGDFTAADATATDDFTAARNGAQTRGQTNTGLHLQGVDEDGHGDCQTADNDDKVDADHPHDIAKGVLIHAGF